MKTIVIMLSILGCVTMAHPQTLVFYRSNYVGSLLKASIHVDGNKVYKLANDHVWRTSVTPGTHAIWGDLEQFAVKDELRAGETYYYRIEFRKFGYKGRATVVPVEENQAMGEVNGLREAKADSQ